MNPSVCSAPVRAQLKAFADRELAPLARFSVARHLRACPFCREELHHMKTLSNDLRESDAPETPLSDELRAHILEQVPEFDDAANEEIARRHRRVTRKKLVLALGTASFAAMIAFASLQNAQTYSSDSARTQSERGASEVLALPPTGASSSGAAESGAGDAAHSPGVVVGKSEVGAKALSPRAAPSIGAASSAGAVSSAGSAGAMDEASGLQRAEPRSQIFSDGHAKTQNDTSASDVERLQQQQAALRREAQGRATQNPWADKLGGSSSASSAVIDSIVPQSRAVHREGSLSVAVNDAEAASDNATAIIKNVGGFVANTSLETGANQKRTATLDCRVPVEKFEVVVQKIGQLGSVRAKSLSGQDITAQVAQSGARRQSLSQELSIAQARLAKIEGAKKRDPYAIYQSRAEVRTIRIQAAQARAALETLQKYGALSSLYVSLQDGTLPAAPKPTGWSDSLSPSTRGAWNSFLSNARLPLQLLLWVLAYSPIWLPALIVWRKYGRKWLEA